MKIPKKNYIFYVSIIYSVLFLASNLEAQYLYDYKKISKKCLEAFDNPNLYTPQQLYKFANEAIKNNQLEEARLYALRIFFDKIRTANLLDLLALIEVKAGNNFLAHEWIQKSLALNPEGTFARKLLAQLPPRGKPANIPPEKLNDHLQQIISRLHILLQRLTTPKQYYDAIVSELNRGHYYKALAITEEFEKKYPGIDAISLTALCAYYLGRGSDLEKILTPALQQNPYHPILLFIKAVTTDNLVETYTNSKMYALYFSDKWEEIPKIANKIQNIHNNSIDAHLIMAQLAVDNQNFEEAERYLSEAEKIDPSNHNIYKIRADAQFYSGYFTRAKNTIQRALPKAYCIPSIPLKLAIYEYSLGNINDALFIFSETKNYFPFIELQAYEPFILLALHLDDTTTAKFALDTWAAKFPKNSSFYYLEAYYNVKINNKPQTYTSLINALSKNQNKLNYIKFFSQISTIKENTQLYQLLKDRLDGKNITQNSLNILLTNLQANRHQSSITQNYSSYSLNQPISEIDKNKSFDINQFSFSKSPHHTPKFNFYISNSINNANIQGLLSLLSQNLEEIIKKIEQTFNFIINNKIDVYIIPSITNSLLAFYDINSDKFIVSSLCFDFQFIKNYLVNNNPNNAFSDEELEALSQWFSKYYLSRELLKATLAIANPQIKQQISNIAWIWHGIAEIYADIYFISRYMLISAQNFISNGKSKLVLIESLNKNLLDITKEESYITACAQSYIMTAYIVKKSTNKSNGIVKAYNLLKDLANQKDLNEALKVHLGITKSEFETGWKEATYWSLKQGLPFEWQ